MGKELADLLFPNIDKTPEYYYEKYPKRNLPEGSRVTRFAPSPTGFVHIGGLFSALISERTASLSKGVFYLRIEDTDKKREIENGVLGIVNALHNFNILNQEGAISEDEEKGAYGPYKQSQRKDIYQAFIKYLITEDKAYPCFCTSEELDEIRKKQEEQNINTGYYGEWAVYRNKTLEEVKKDLDLGKNFVIRVKSTGNVDKKISYKDIIRGELEFPENLQDIVICKSDGLPTYHFAHVVDDYLMGTTHVIRGEEWLASVPTHLQLFYIMGWKAPKYAHIPTILKMEDTSKRKLSKRKDPEAAVSFYHEEGYPVNSVLEYLLNLCNSNFEDWRKNNPTKSLTEFPFKLEKLGSSGALFDMVKLTDLSKNVISVIKAEDIYNYLLEWSAQYDKEFNELVVKYKDKLTSFLTIDRTGKKPRKDISKWSDIKYLSSYMFEEIFNPEYDFAENLSKEQIKEILVNYAQVFNENDTKDEWFNRVKDFSEKLGYAGDMKAFKENPESFKGNISDTTNAIRVAITGRRQSPDLYEIMKILGKDIVVKRLLSIN
ncbi:MAG: glutamate--tRNA ligase [Candidatus Sericytochromatia bacterium]